MKLTLNKRFYIRAAVIILVILLGILMFIIGKQHTILLDNKTSGDFPALDTVLVQVDKLPELELYKRDRDQAVVTNQKHKVRITYTDKQWNEIVIEKTIKLPHSESMMLLSIPTLVANPDAPQEVWLTHFESMAVQVEAEDATVVTEDALMGAEF